MDSIPLIQSCAERNWQLQLGDPDIVGLVLTAIYILVSLLFVHLILTRKDWRPRERRLWLACTIIIVLLAINKHLDLQHFIGMVGHCVLLSKGWYWQHRAFQRDYAMALLATGVIGILTIGWVSRIALRPNWRLVLGMLLLAAYVDLQVARFEKIISPILSYWITQLDLYRQIETAALLVLLWAVLQRRSGRLH